MLCVWLDFVVTSYDTNLPYLSPKTDLRRLDTVMVNKKKDAWCLVTF